MFPANPSIGDEYVHNGTTFVWNGDYWGLKYTPERYMDKDGALGELTDPAAALANLGGAAINSRDAVKVSQLVASDGSPDPAVMVDDAGNVGIGTSTPSEALDVSGVIRCGNIQGQIDPTGLLKLYAGSDATKATIQLYGPNHATRPGWAWIQSATLNDTGNAAIPFYNYTGTGWTLLGQFKDDSSLNVYGNVIVFGDVQRSGEVWNNLTLENGWVNFGSGWATAQYRKLPDGRVEIKGLVKSGTVNAAIGTLPLDCRPSEGRMFVTMQGNNTTVRMAVNSNGSIITNGATVNTFQSIECSFYP